MGLPAAKGALDATLAGYYVGDFGDIRQLAEYWFGMEYLALKPESLAGLYREEPGEQQVRLPKMGIRISDVLAAFAPRGASADAEYLSFAQLVHRTYKRMSDGHHLDGLAMCKPAN